MDMKERSNSKESQAYLFRRYMWLVDLIYRYDGKLIFDDDATGKENWPSINAEWKKNLTLNQDGTPLPKRTFHRYVDAIGEMFEIDIVCDRKNGYRYRIENREELETGGIRQWLVNTFAVNHLINESHALKDRILFEEIPSGQRYLTQIIEAMRDSHALRMTYQGFYSDSSASFDVDPLCVKVFRQRWYMVGDSEAGRRIYALDRIVSLETTSEKFAMPEDFDGASYFFGSYGVIVDGSLPPEIVRVRVAAPQNLYIRSLPLHHSQNEVETTDIGSVFEYFVSPTYDFVQELLSHGPDLEVLEPASLRAEVASAAAEMAKLYCSNMDQSHT
jgi:hypothetical protein